MYYLRNTYRLQPTHLTLYQHSALSPLHTTLQTPISRRLNLTEAVPTVAVTAAVTVAIPPDETTATTTTVATTPVTTAAITVNTTATNPPSS